jgi:hypothetical protein
MISANYRHVVLFAIFLIFPIFAFSQDLSKWYTDMPSKAEIQGNSSIMSIGNKTYPVYNAFNPIAPTGGERVIDFAGTLNYYIWTFKRQNGEFTAAKIDMDLNIYYYDETIEKFISPNGDILDE